MEDIKRAEATAKMVRIAPRKARLVIDLVRGKDLNHAYAILMLTDKKASKLISKVIKSAAANAVHNYELDANKLYVEKAVVDDGPTLKRFRPRAKGGADQILKRTSHITIVVAERE